jgi:hypothetical protein
MNTMDKRGFVFLIVVMVSLSLLGCTGTSKIVSTGKAFIGGTDGVKIAFQEGSPPGEIFDNNFPFDITAVVDNKGEFDIPAGGYSLELIGVDLSEFGITGTGVIESTVDLKGAYLDADNNKILGDSAYETWSSPAGFQGTLVGNHQFIVRADICYDYGTLSQAWICVKQDMSDTTKAVCDVSANPTSESSSGPVQISDFTERPAGVVDGNNRILVTFKVSSKGSGLVFKTASGCPTSDRQLRMASENLVDVTVTMSKPDDFNIECQQLGGGSSGELKLYNGEQNVRCTLTVLAAGAGDYTTGFNVEARYAYKDHVEQGLLVKHIK